MPQPASIEADEYSRWVGANLDADAGEVPAIEAAPAGESIVIVAGVDADGGRLDKWLAVRLPAYSRSRIQRWIADGHASIDGRVAVVRDAVHAGDRIVIAPQAADDETAFRAEDIALDVVHEDDALLVIDKRAGLVVHPAAGNWTGTVLNGLLFRDPALAALPRAGIVHRLDKDTTGLMVVAKTLVAQTDLVRQLQARTVSRRYLAIVHGTPPGAGRIDRPIGRDPRDRLKMKAFGPGEESPGMKPAATRFETLASVMLDGGRTASLVACRLETGRTHQIRVHLQAIGNPLLGDAVYGGAHGPVPFGRQALHAWRLGLVHPVHGRALSWKTPPPADFAALADVIGIDLARLPDDD